MFSLEKEQSRERERDSRGKLLDICFRLVNCVFTRERESHNGFSPPSFFYGTITAGTDISKKQAKPPSNVKRKACELSSLSFLFFYYFLNVIFLSVTELLSGESFSIPPSSSKFGSSQLLDGPH